MASDKLRLEHKLVMVCWQYLSIIGYALWVSFVIWRLWHWFVVPGLHWPALSYGQVLGAYFIIQILSAKTDFPLYIYSAESSHADIKIDLQHQLPLIFLIIGWLVH